MKPSRLVAVLAMTRSAVLLVAGLVHDARGQTHPSPPFGYVYAIIRESNAISDAVFSAADLHLPPLPPGLAIGLVPKPTNVAESVPLLFNPAQGLLEPSSQPNRAR